MKTSPTTSSALIRRFRLQRKLSLEVASAKLRLSIAVLSRLERGIRMPTRDELIAMSKVYALTPWESHTLLVTSGFLPDPPPVGNFADEQQRWEGLLRQLPYPAFVMDPNGYVLMWNAQLRAVWQVDGTRRVHILESINSPMGKGVLGKAWDEKWRAAMWFYYIYSITAPQAKPDPGLLAHLSEVCGGDFVHLWNEAIARGHASPPERILDQIGIEVSHQSAVGTARYFVTQVGARSSAASALFLWIPVDAESLQKHLLLSHSLPQEVYTVESDPSHK